MPRNCGFAPPEAFAITSTCVLANSAGVKADVL